MLTSSFSPLWCLAETAPCRGRGLSFALAPDRRSRGECFAVGTPAACSTSRADGSPAFSQPTGIPAAASPFPALCLCTTASGASRTPPPISCHSICIADIPTSESGERGSYPRSTCLHRDAVETASQRPRRRCLTPPPTPGSGQSVRDCLTVRSRVRSSRCAGMCLAFSFPFVSILPVSL